MAKAKKTIVICSSAAFYEHVNQLADELKELGFSVEVPSTAERMKREGSYDVKRIKTWYDNPEDLKIKQKLAKEHFDKVSKGDAVLIVNDDKPHQKSYIGPNAMMEWGLAYYLGKPVYILNPVGKDLHYFEEALGLTAGILNGDLTKIKL